MPKPAPWDWAKPRIIPLLAGPSFDLDGESVVRATAGPGCAVEFGLDLGGVFAKVDQLVAERWECTSGHLLEAGLANLRARLARLSPDQVGTGALSGRLIRRLTRPRGCAASAVLMPSELLRLFGSHDQVFAAPTQSLLVSFPIDTPEDVLADAVVDMEMNEPLPLLYDPFVLIDGRLHWQPDDDGPSLRDRASNWPAA